MFDADVALCVVIVRAHVIVTLCVCAAVGNVEDWLGAVELAMKRAVKVWSTNSSSCSCTLLIFLLRFLRVLCVVSTAIRNCNMLPWFSLSMAGSHGFVIESRAKSSAHA